MLTLADRPRKMRPTFAAMMAIERDLGVALPKVIERFEHAGMDLRGLAVVLRHGLIAAGEAPAPTLEQVAEQAFRAGYINLVDPVSQFLTNCLTGGRAPGEPTAGGNGAAPSPTAGS